MLCIIVTKEVQQTFATRLMRIIGCYMLNAHGLMLYHIVILESLTLQRWCTMKLGYGNDFVVDLMLSTMVNWMDRTLN